MKYIDFLKGVEILESWADGSLAHSVDGMSVTVSHDCPLDKEAVSTLLELGWTQDEPRAGAYNPNKGWTAHDVGAFLKDGK